MHDSKRAKTPKKSQLHPEEKKSHWKETEFYKATLQTVPIIKRVRSKQGKDPITQMVAVKLLEPLDQWTLVEGGGLRWKNSVFAASNLIHPACHR